MASVANPGPGRLVLWILALLGAALMVVVATVPMAPLQQAIFAGLTALAFMIGNAFPGRPMTMCLMALSLAMSLRYLVWRVTETLHFDGPLALLLGTGLVLAEIHAVTVLVLGYAQTAWPLRRGIRPLPPAPDRWPRVDVYIPTYNEPLSVVRATVLAAMAMDWPPDRLSVFLLDDGRRDEFRRFAEQIGCFYLPRADNRHAKAGNLNHAMRYTSGDFIAVFDCDHIPTRAFLQLTLGWLVAEPRLAVVQTPHHFHSPDPFQRNLAAGTRVPPESHLFHGLVQDGSDTWGATLFCGSGAVLRRAALEDIGGFAVETVTEDAHTMLKLHRRGWGSAYLGLPLAAGLATERLSRHLRQRLRWARGLLQILRLDNPLFGPGLTPGQRLCYLQAAGHFLFALPRLVFLTAPLAFLLLGQNIIAASPLAITAYAVPHLFHAVATNARLHGRWRHSFWGEIYETVLALLLIRVIVATLLSPRRGGFDVTAKGGLPEDGFFDLRAVFPNLILTGLLLAGLGRASVSLLLFDNPPLVFQALVLNAVWAGLALLTVLAALAVGREARQARDQTWVPASLPVSLLLPDGTLVDATATRLSQSGGHVTASIAVPPGADVEVMFTLASERVRVPAHVRRADATGVHLQWEPRTLAQESGLIQAIFGRADAWSDWARFPRDRPLRSLGHVLRSIGGLFRSGARPVVAYAVLAVLLSGWPARAETSDPSTTHLPATAAHLPLPPPPPAPAPPPQTPAAGTPDVPPPAPAPTASPPQNSARHVVFNLRQLGATRALALSGTSESRTVTFGVRGDEVVTAAQLSLSGAMSSALLPDVSNITVTLNDQYIGTIPANREQPDFTTDLPVNPLFFQDINRLSFRFAGRYAPDCNDPLSKLLWATVYEASTLTLTLQRLPPQRDLARLPLPLFDPAVRQRLTLPVILPAEPGNDTLRAAAIVASWFGAQSGFRGASFPVAASVPEQGNAVVILADGDGAALPGLPAIDGPTLALIPNPTDELASLLVVAGRNEAEAAEAASALSTGNRVLSGGIAAVRAPTPAPRVPYDAPNWIATDRPVRLGALVDAADLQSEGYTGLLRVPFHTAPDFFTWRDAAFKLDLRFRAPPGPIVDVAASRLDVGINGIYLDSVPLATDPADRWMSWLSALFGVPGEARDTRIGIPTYDVFGFNDLQFYFDARPLHRGECTALPGDLRMAVDPDSTIDLSAGMRFTQLPNLAFFLNSGFPFTRMADLSQTAVVVADQPGAEELRVMLDLMGRMGAQTGAAVTRVAVTRPDGAAAFADRDLLLIGTLPHLGTAERLLAGVPLRIDGNRLVLALPGPLDPVRQLFGVPDDADRRRAATVLNAGLAPGMAMLVGAQSPLSPGRSVVALLAADPNGLSDAMEMLRDPDQASLVQGDLSLLTGGRVTSYRIGGHYTVGHLPVWMWPSWALRDQPFGLAGLVLAAAALLGLALFWTLRRRAALRQPPRPEDGRI